MTGLVKCSLMLMVLALTLLCSLGTLNATNPEQTNTKDTDDSVIPRGKFLTVPNNSLTRFLFYNARPFEQQPNSLLGYKRSSSNLDALTGMTLGKRSKQMDYINIEPYYGRTYAMRSVPRIYDLRWTPSDSYQAPVVPAELN